MIRRILSILLVLTLVALPALGCVGKTLIVGTDSTARSRVVAQLLAILINERTGTTIEIVDYASGDELFKEMTGGNVDMALAYASSALTRMGKDVPADPQAAFKAVKKAYQEELNLIWLGPLGFSDEANPSSLAAPIAQKHALKKFPALPRLIAKTSGLLPLETIQNLSEAENIAKAVRDFLKDKKLI